MKYATKEFVVGYTKYTPRSATVNGVAGYNWMKKKLIDERWVHQEMKFVRKEAAEIEVEASFVGGAT